MRASPIFRFRRPTAGTAEPLPALRRTTAGFFLCGLFFLLVTFPSAPSQAFDLFSGHEVKVHFATPQGVPLANATVRVFAPGDSKKPAFLGRTDAKGDYSFSAHRKGFWTAEAAGSGAIVRIMVRVGGEESGRRRFPPYLLPGLVVALFAIALGVRLFVRRRQG